MFAVCVSVCIIMILYGPELGFCMLSWARVSTHSPLGSYFLLNSAPYC